MNFFNQGIPLGRWFGITVVVSWTFLLYAFWLFRGAEDVTWTLLLIVVIFGSVLLHEFGHCFACRAVGGEAFHILLWPLGGLAFVKPPMNPTAELITVVGGPLVNAVLWTLFWLIERHGLPHLAMYMSPDGEAFQFIGMFVYAMIWANRVQFLFNVLVPVFPMDSGRILHCILWYVLGYRRSLLIAGMTGTVGGIGFVVLGLGLTQVTIPIAGITLGGEPSLIIMAMGVFFAMQSFAVYRQAELIGTWRKN